MQHVRATASGSVSIAVMIEPIGVSTDGPEVLFLGEAARGGYVDGALSTCCRLTKLPAAEPLAGSEVEHRLRDYAVIVLSDYPAGQLSAAHQQQIAEAVERDGRGLLMIGGWASFGGPLGSYHGSRIAELLPVELAREDDRINTPLGTVFRPSMQPHAAIQSISGQSGCVVVGYNRVLAKSGATVLVDGYRLDVDAKLQPSLEHVQTPMLSVWQRGAGRVAALAPDVMPHWAGGIMDWGDQRLRLPTGNEVGHLYVALLGDLCRWLAGLT